MSEYVLKKIKQFLKGKIHYFFIFLIIILSLTLRLYGLYKPFGLWYDEGWSYYIAKQSFPLGILDKVYNEELTPPFYFISLHFWMELFGKNQLVLRFLSVLYGILFIPVAYLAGKELNSRKTGFILALLSGINSFLIYYSQEVRNYAPAALFSALTFLFLLKIKNKPDKINFAGLIFAHIGILYTSGLGFIFVGTETLILGMYFYLYHREIFKKYIISALITAVLFLPYIPFILHQSALSSHDLANNPPLWNFYLFYQHINKIILSWFTPATTGITYISGFKLINEYNLSFIAFIVMPFQIYLYGMIRLIKQRGYTAAIFMTGICSLIILITLSALGKFTFYTRYTMIIFPIIFLSACYGLSLIKNKLLTGLFITFLVLINLFYTIYSPFSAQKLGRSHTFTSEIADILKRINLNSDDIILCLYAGDFLDFEYEIKSKFISNNLEYSLIVDKNRKFLGESFLRNIFDKKFLLSARYIDMKKAFRGYLASEESASALQKFIKNEIADKLPEKHYFILVKSKTKGIYTEQELSRISSSEDTYSKAILIEMIYSKVYNEIIKTADRYLKPAGVISKGDWEVYIFEKSRER